ncbi:MAG TPA: NAD(P)H-hydrate dehydratase [Gammaproteobacteria bacterium]|nr:NAD(P)H-hydrate dehydratase [Gammaproteobacteria bacterium]
MDALPQQLYGIEASRELDRKAIDELGIPGYELMCRAGQAALTVLLRCWPRSQRLLVFCGSGNNGGDGYVLATMARKLGLFVQVVTTGSARSSECRQAAADWLAAGGEICRLPAQAAAMVEWLAYADVVVDGILGTGVDRPVTGQLARLLAVINTAEIPVLALDVPSGLHAQRGTILGVAVRAAATVAFIGLNQGLLTASGPACCGQIYFSSLQLPASLYQGIASGAIRLGQRQIQESLPVRLQDAHKGQFGHVLVVGGDCGMSGAARLTARAALSSGSGLVSLATHAGHAGNANTDCPELMVIGLTGSDDPLLQRALDRASVLALGPGLGQSNWGRKLFEHLRAFPGPMVVDADGLNLLARDPDQNGDRILTPHPAEAARLLGVSTPEIQQDRFSAVLSIARRYAGVCVLKGAGTLIAGADEQVWLCDRGDPGMATAGMGDVLTGIIAGLLAQGLGLIEAAQAGVWMHAVSAERHLGAYPGQVVRASVVADHLDLTRPHARLLRV